MSGYDNGIISRDKKNRILTLSISYPKIIMYRRQNTQEDMDTWIQLQDQRVYCKVSKCCCQLNSYFLSLLTFMIQIFLNCCRVIYVFMRLVLYVKDF